MAPSATPARKRWQPVLRGSGTTTSPSGARPTRNNGKGLNLTFEVLDAIRKSSKTRDDIFAEGWGVPETLVGQVVKTADAIAYVNHDIIDAIRAGLITEENLPHSSKHDLGRSHSERLNTMICDIVEASWAATGAGENPVIQFSPKVHAAANELREFMFASTYDETAEAGAGSASSPSSSSTSCGTRKVFQPFARTTR
jgi:dGTP triphosphohydrolase